MAENEPETAEPETAEPETAEPEEAGPKVAPEDPVAEETRGTSAPIESAPRAPKDESPSGGDHHRANRRKSREGLVVSTAMDKTAVVAVTERVRHAKYSKTVQRTKKLYVHDENNEANDGDRVRVAETRPLSKTKRWRLVEVLERAR